MIPLTREEVAACSHPRLPLRYVIALICVAALAPIAIALSLAGAVSLILPWIVFLAWLSMETLFACFYRQHGAGFGDQLSKNIQSGE